MALYQSGAGLGALVGVGTTNPTSNLQVYGTPIAAGNVFSVFNTAASGNVAQFSSSSGTALIINSIGNVGVGTTNPTSNLQVVGNVLSGNVISSVAMYGVLAGSNTVAASTVTATSLIGTHYGAIVGSNTISASTIYGVIAGANTIACSSVTAQGIAAAGAVYLTGNTIEIGQGQTSDSLAVLDLHTAEGTYSDFAFRILRNAGANGSVTWVNRGSGNSYFQNQDSGGFYFQSGGVDICSITDGGVIYFGKSNYTATTGTRPGTNKIMSYDCVTPSVPTASTIYYGTNVVHGSGTLSGRMWNNSGAPSFYAADTFFQAGNSYDGTNNGTGAANQYAGNLYLDGGLAWCLGGSGTTNQCYAGNIYLRTGLSGGGLTTGTPTNRMVIMANTGYAGIGIMNPGCPLTLYGGTSTPVLQVHDSSGGPDYASTYGMVNLTRAADTTKAHLAFIRAGNMVWQIGYVNAANSLGIFPGNLATSGTPSLCFGSDGNVGVGNTTPPIKLWVPGTSTTTGIGVYNGDVALIIGNVAGAINAGSIQVRSSGSSSTIGTINYTLCLNPDGGNVGVGTNTVGYKLHAYGGAIAVTGTNNYLYYAITNSTSSGAYMLFDAASAGGSGRKYQIGSTGTGNNPGTGCFELYDATGGATRMVVNSSGYVGVATTNPLSRLTVKCGYSDGGAGGLCIDATDGSVYNMQLCSYVQSGSQVAYKFIINNVASSTAGLYLGYNGNIGIFNSSPAYALHVTGEIKASTNVRGGSHIVLGGGAWEAGAIYSDTNWGILNRAYQASPVIAQYAWYESTGVTQIMQINPSYHLGIGTASPESRLSVYNGDSSYQTFGPNVTWGAKLRVGAGSGYTSGTSQVASIMVSNGNLHIDAAGGYALYLNYFSTATAGAGATINMYGAISTNSTITAAGDITAFSDIRHKANLEIINNALDKVTSLNGYTFTRTDLDDKETRHTGVVAQEVLEILPEAILTNKEGVHSVAYGNLAGLFIEALKEERAKREALEERLSILEKLLTKQ